MRSDPSIGTAKSEQRTWQQMVAKYQNPSMQRSLWQVANTLIPYFVLLTLMYVSLSYSYWLTLALALPAGGLLTRAFIIFHDCGHGSFFKSQRANTFLGSVCGVLVFTPYYQWRYEHAVHHATSGDLDRRGVGDIITMTVDEYLKLPRWGRFKYRLYRSPIVMLGLGPWFTFLISQRFVNPISKKRERFSVYFSNLFIVALLVVAATIFSRADSAAVARKVPDSPPTIRRATAMANSSDQDSVRDRRRRYPSTTRQRARLPLRSW